MFSIDYLNKNYVKNVIVIKIKNTSKINIYMMNDSKKKIPLT